MKTNHPFPPVDSAKPHPGERILTFGDLIAGGYRAWGNQKAKGIIRLALKAHLVEFRGADRFMIS
jgi:hypothetical protein